MFQHISKTGAGLYITLIVTVLNLLGVEFDEGTVASAVNGIGALIGLILLVVGQFSRPDLKVGLVRKTPNA